MTTETTETAVSDKRVMKTMGELFGIEGAGAKAPWPVALVPHPMTPKSNVLYLFREDLLRKVLLWAAGVAGKNLLISGPTGSGKTSLAEEFCARTGRGFYRVACHGRLEFSDLVGQLTLLSDGSTSFVHGPLVRAMREGAVLAMDEFNFVPPAISGALNTVLDGGALLIPQTGELIEPHPEFRIVATGNAVDRGDDAASYAGTQRMNLAMIQRFLTMKVSYLEPLQEAQVLHRIAPKLPGKVITTLVELAKDVREAFMRGDMDTTIATRTLERVVKVLSARLEALKADPAVELKFALQFVLTDGLHPASAQTVEGLLQRAAGGMKLTESDWPSVGAASVAESSTAGEKSELLSFLVNPDRTGQGPAFWGYRREKGSSECRIFSGTLETGIPRNHGSINQADANQRHYEKRNSRGYVISAEVLTRDANAELSKTLKLLKEWYAGFTQNQEASRLNAESEKAATIANTVIPALGGKARVTCSQP